MRVFVVLASLVALISADVSHLNHGTGHKTTTYTHTVPSVSYGHGSSGSFQTGGSSSFAADPVVNFVQTPVRTVHNYIKPAVQTVTRYVETAPVVHHVQAAPAVQTHYVQQQAAPVVHQTHYVQAAPAVQTHYVQQAAPAVQTHYVQQAAPVVHTVSRFSGDGGFGNGVTYGSGFSGSSGFGGSSFGGSNLYDSSSSYGSGHSTYRTTLVKQTAPLVTKSSYVFAAPEDHDEIQRDQTIVLPRPRIHYNAVFVKAPSSTVVNTPSAAFAPQTQEKTLIYVLSDKKRVENHIQLPQLDAAAKAKPQVFFIKNNKPTEKVNSHVRYETVHAVNGAEFGAHNGVANSGSSSLHSRIDDTVSTGEDSHVAHTIFQGLQSQGLQGGLNAFNTLQGQGISVGTYDDSASSSSGSSSASGSGGSGFQSIINAGSTAVSSGANAVSVGTNAFGAGSNAATTGLNSFVNSFFPSASRGSFVETVETVEKPVSQVSYTTTTTTDSGSSGSGDAQYHTGAIVPVVTKSSSTSYESDSSDAGSSYAEFSSSDSSDFHSE